jgi:putative oxidoreductase
VNAFIHLGVPAPEFFVILAGLCELGAAIALGLGLMMRIGAIGTVLYLLMATYLGHHFSLGFIWAAPGGGWEYATMWMVLILSFAISGVHRFSIDQYLESYFKLPSFIKKCL